MECTIDFKGVTGGGFVFWDTFATSFYFENNGEHEGSR